ncbi:MAG: DUF4982 domain-containing protein [Bacteroidales bacterium]|nr:DUF4982 domain-containing protein [Bacteroidales bacterium]
MKTKLAILLLPLLVATCAPKEDFSAGWSFWSDTAPEPTTVTLPHDAMLTENRRVDAPSGFGSAYFETNGYHYEKHLEVPAEWLGKHVVLHFGGVYRNATVSVNGIEAGKHAYGFTPFDVCMDGLLIKGSNTIRVDVDNSEAPNIRWYSGAGIYRPVQLIVKEKIHIEDVQIATLSVNPARISVVTLHNSDAVRVKIMDGKRLVAQANGDDVAIEIPDAKLWNAEHPNLYTAEVEILSDGEVTDREVIEFGIRTLEWDTEGFRVNGETVLLAGAGIHHDNGILGAAEYEDAAFRRVQKMKEIGFNAIRSAHNPLSEEMLKACDRLGMYVMDELYDGWFASKMKYDYHTDFPNHFQEDLEAMVRKDWNHPSVVMYSIGNELTEPALPGGMQVASQMIDRIHELDSTRPVTCGINLSILSDAYRNQDKPEQSAATMELLIQMLMKPMDPGVSSLDFNEANAQNNAAGNEALKSAEVDGFVSPFLDMLDIAGYNYGEPRYALDREVHPERVIVGSETMITNLHRNWELVKTLPNVIGDFCWTGWDYIGETGAGAWRYGVSSRFAQPYPWLLGNFGAIDILGNPEGEAFLAKTVYSGEPMEPYICVRPVREDIPFRSSWRRTNSIPSWSWKGSEGISATVEVITNAPKAELIANGKSLGIKETEGNIATFELPYEPGALEAYAIYENERTYARMESASGALQLQLKAETSHYNPGELIYVNVDIVGENGVTESMADEVLTCTVEGGDLLGFGSACPTPDGYYFRDGRYPSHYGKAQAIIRATQKGIVKMTVSGETLDSKSIKIKI